MSADLVYGQATGLLRRVVVPSVASHNILDGEVILVVSDEEYASFSGRSDIQAHINSVTGRVPSGYQAAMIDEAGNVVSLHHADPVCDKPYPGHKLVWISPSP